MDEKKTQNKLQQKNSKQLLCKPFKQKNFVLENRTKCNFLSYIKKTVLLPIILHVSKGNFGKRIKYDI